MKKRLLLMMAVMAMTALAAQSQSFEFRYHGEAIADGATVTIPAAADEFDELSCVTNPTSNPTNGLMLKMNTSGTANFTARLEIEHNSLNPEVLQWCMGGICTPFSNGTSLDKTFSASDDTQVQFDATNIKAEGYLLARLSVTKMIETHTVYIKFTNGNSADINDIGTGTGDVRHDIYDLQGRRIAQPTQGLYIMDGKKIILR